MLRTDLVGFGHFLITNGMGKGREEKKLTGFTSNMKIESNRGGMEIERRLNY